MIDEFERTLAMVSTAYLITGCLVSSGLGIIFGKTGFGWALVGLSVPVVPAAIYMISREVKS